MKELHTHKKLLIAYKSTFALKKKINDPENWYPSSAKEIESLLKDFLKDIPIAKINEKELNDFLHSSYAQVIDSDLTIKSKKRADHKEWLFENRKVWKDANDTNSQFAYYRSKVEVKLGNSFNEMDSSTDSILNELQDPTQSGKWETKGMVVGDVQSGKTSNYTGLIAKAIDVGYKVIIVLAGSYNSLRSQTQSRMEQSLISASQKGDCNRVFFGTKTPTYRWLNGVRTIQVENDFDLNTAKKISITHKDPIVLVVKKLVPILSNILIWLNEQKGMPKNQDKEWKWNELKWKQETIRNSLPKFQIQCPQPLLLIDDECDSASIDIGRRKKSILKMTDEEKENFRNTDPSKTNQLIRRILLSFEKNAYVGYTATPLANAFVSHTSFTYDDGLDIFPRDFIKLLFRNSAYNGPEQVFGVADKNYEEGNEILRLSENIDKNEKPQVKWIYDYRDDFDDDEFLEDGKLNEEKRDQRYKKEGKKGEDPVDGWLPLYHDMYHHCRFKQENTIPESLKKAIHSFLINIAIRSFREKETHHNSMLVHVSRLTTIQNNVMGQIKKYLDDLANKISYAQEKSTTQSVKDIFNEIWETDTKQNIDKFKHPNDINIKFDKIWDKISSLLTDDSKKIDLIRINTTSDDNLAYDEKKNGWNVIVVGGAALARGITLEGLSVSYFLRLAKIPTSDTLIQMGRWFGYRVGYEDLYRVYCPKALHILFRQFSFSMESAREKFRELMNLKLDPEDYAIEVPCFPGWNLVSKSKSKDITVVKEPFSSVFAQNHQTIHFYSNKEREFNSKITHDLIDKLSDNFEDSRKINERLKRNGVWFPKFDKKTDNEKIDKNLSLEEIKASIYKIKTKTVELTNSYLWKNVDIKLLTKYLDDYKSPPTMRDWNSKIIAQKIRLLNKYKKINSWNIGLFSRKESKKNPSIIFKNKNIQYPLQWRGLDSPFGNDFSIGTLADPNADFMDIEKGTFDKGMDNWIEMYKATGKSVSKKNWLPAGFQPRIRQQRKDGLLIIYPWTTKYLEEGFDPEKDIYFGWQIIIPPTREEGDDKELYYDNAYNEAGYLARLEDYKEAFKPELDS